MLEEITQEERQANVRAIEEMEHFKFKKYLYSQVAKAMRAENVSSDNPLGRIIEERSKPLPPIEMVATKIKKDKYKRHYKQTHPRGYYNNKEYRLKDTLELLVKKSKKPFQLSVPDFSNTYRDNGTSYASVIDWYKRYYNPNSKIKIGEARYLLIRDLFGKKEEEKARKYVPRGAKGYQKE